LSFGGEYIRYRKTIWRRYGMESVIDVRQIMAEIDSSIDSMSEEEKRLSFNDGGSRGLEDVESMRFDHAVLGSIIDFCRTHSRVESFRDLNVPGVKKAKPFIMLKKVIRRLTQFYVEPVVNDQAEFNANVVLAMDQVDAFIQENQDLKARLDRQEKRIAELEKQLNM
jgi:hypothetical protein